MTKVTLTPEQIQNWRMVLCGMIGPYALIMPAEMVQEWKDKFQSAADKSEEEMKNNEKTK